MNESEETGLFIDKIQLSASVIIKEAKLIEIYNKLLSDIKSEFIDLKRLERDSIYNDCLTVLAELNDYLEFNKIKEIEKKQKPKVERLRDIMNKYNTITPNIRLSFVELQEAYTIIREFISIAGYHDDKTNKPEIKNWGDID